MAQNVASFEYVEREYLATIAERRELVERKSIFGDDPSACDAAYMEVDFFEVVDQKGMGECRKRYSLFTLRRTRSPLILNG